MDHLKIITVIGARPQLIKAAMVSRAIRENNARSADHEPRIAETIVHTGQHYDYQMSQVFFDQLDFPAPDHHLDIGSGSHGDQTGRMLSTIERVLVDERPDAVLVYGDTNSTLAGALAAAKLHIPVGHVEGGMRSFNRRMPEEINRILTDHVAEWHFCTTKTAVMNLKAEGITDGVHLVGNVMRDAAMLYKDIAAEKSDILRQLGLAGKYALATIHRAENTDDPARLQSIFEALAEISRNMAVVLPLHPRTRKALESGGLCSHAERSEASPLMIIDPVPYLDNLQLEQHASIILTDSGGMQNEAFWLGVPCVTMRDETEWVETVEAGWNSVAGARKESILRSVAIMLKSANRRSIAKNSLSASACILESILTSL